MLSGTLLRHYAHGLGTDDPILWYEGAALSDRRSLHADHQGSVIGVANSSGTSIAINAYDSWGVPNAGNAGRFQYTGQAWLPELGMYHYKARIYSPTLGRFLQTDPVGYDDQANLYAYVGNDPVNGRDPTGTVTSFEGFVDYASTNFSHEEKTVTGAAMLAGLGFAASLMVPDPSDVAISSFLVATVRNPAFGAKVAQIGWNLTAGGKTLVLWNGKIPNLKSNETAIFFKSGWTQSRNDKLISFAMKQNRPIRDSRVDARTGRQLDAAKDSVIGKERNQIEAGGWKYNEKTQHYEPPKRACTGSLVKTSGGC